MSRVQVPLLTPRRTAGRTSSGLRSAVSRAETLPNVVADVAGSSPVTHPKKNRRPDPVRPAVCCVPGRDSAQRGGRCRGFKSRYSPQEEPQAGPRPACGLLCPGPRLCPTWWQMSRVQVPLLTPRRTAGRTPSGLRSAVSRAETLPNVVADVAGSSPVTHPKKNRRPDPVRPAVCCVPGRDSAQRGGRCRGFKSRYSPQEEPQAGPRPACGLLCPGPRLCPTWWQMSRVQVPLLTPRRTAGRTSSGLRFAVSRAETLPNVVADVAGSSPVTHPKKNRRPDPVRPAVCCVPGRDSAQRGGRCRGFKSRYSPQEEPQAGPRPACGLLCLRPTRRTTHANPGPRWSRLPSMRGPVHPDRVFPWRSLTR